MSKTKSRNSVSKGAALSRARLVIDATLMAFRNCEDKPAHHIAAKYIELLEQFYREDTPCSSEAAKLLHTVQIGYRLLKSFYVHRDPFIGMVAAGAIVLCESFLREYVPRPDRPQGDLVAQVRAGLDNSPAA